MDLSKAFKPGIAIKIEALDAKQEKLIGRVAALIDLRLRGEFKTLFDVENKVVYLKKK